MERSAHIRELKMSMQFLPRGAHRRRVFHRMDAQRMPNGRRVAQSLKSAAGCENRFSAVPVEREVRFRRTVELEFANVARFWD